MARDSLFGERIVWSGRPKVATVPSSYKALSVLAATVAAIALLFSIVVATSLHVFVGFVLIPPVLLKLASTGWRFARYYTGARAYVEQGPPRLAMRLLAPLFVAATFVLFASGVAMAVLHGHALTVARQLHGPSSVIWMALLGVHVLVYLKACIYQQLQ